MSLRRPSSWLQGRRAGPENTLPRWGEVGVHGIHRLREWDEVVMVEADGPVEDDVELVVLPDGTVAGGDPDEAELAAALPFEPPYRARAVLRGLRLWAVGVRRIRVATFRHAGDEIELAVRDGTRSLRVDGAPASGGIPALEALIRGDGVVRATRIADDDWEVRVDRL
ncbi:MAG TPA: hypothetical protein VH416_02970 [Gaiellaceae bacterium]|jgi:hypothetical protein